MPVLIIATIVDRNPIGTYRIRRKLNKFVEDVRLALLDHDKRVLYAQSLERSESDFLWVTNLDIPGFFDSGFFFRFAGQGRLRWHYGVAHSILADVESDFIAQHGRGWLSYRGYRNAMELGSGNVVGLRYFDFRMVWQIASAIVIVSGAAGGAFILSCTSPFGWM